MQLTGQLPGWWQMGPFSDHLYGKTKLYPNKHSTGAPIQPRPASGLCASQQALRLSARRVPPTPILMATAGGLHLTNFKSAVQENNV